MKTEKLCLCKAIMPCLIICKSNGSLPVSIHHKNGNCRFQSSNVHFFYAFVSIMCLSASILYSTDVVSMLTSNIKRPMNEKLSSITVVIYSFSILLLLIINTCKGYKYAGFLNHLTDVAHEAGLLCQSSLRTLRKIQYISLAGLLSVAVAHFSIISFYHFTEIGSTTYILKIYINQINHYTTFLFFLLHMTSGSIMIAMCACFMKLAVNCLKTQSRPLAENFDFDEDISFCGILRLRFCSEDHVSDQTLVKMSVCKRLDYLRCMHEKICIVIKSFNSCFDHQFLTFMFFEILVLTNNFYLIIVYYMFDLDNSILTHALHCLFAFYHTIGIYVILSIGQKILNMVSVLYKLIKISSFINVPYHETSHY